MIQFLIWPLFISLTYAQVFTEDISKINHFLAEAQLDLAAQTPKEDSIPAHYFKSLVPNVYYDPITNCEIDPIKFLPTEARYQLLLISEGLSQDPNLDSEIKIVLAKIKSQNDESTIKALKDVLKTNDENPGVFNLKYSNDAKANIIHYVAPETSITMQSKLELVSAASVNLSEKKEATNPFDMTVQMGVVNRLDFQQNLTSSTSLKAALEATYSNHGKILDSSENLKLETRSFSSSARIDSKIDHHVQGFSEINVARGPIDQTTRISSGINIQIPNNAEILIFTGRRGHKNLHQANLASEESKEIGIEYRKENDFKIYTRFREGEEGNVIETGVEMRMK